MAGEQNGRGPGLYRTLGWSRDFPRVYGEPLQSIRYWRKLFQEPLKSIVEFFWQGLHKPMKCIKALFERGVKKG